jgi:hypothetical protein
MILTLTLTLTLILTLTLTLTLILTLTLTLTSSHKKDGDGSLSLDEILERTIVLALEQKSEDTAAAIGAATEDVELQFTGNAKV